MDRKLQRHRADSLRHHGFLVHIGKEFLSTNFTPIYYMCQAKLKSVAPF